MRAFRSHIALVLIAVLTLTGHSMAVARGMPTASGMMELCTGTGPIMVPVDAEGQRTGPSHICPEFSLSLMDLVAIVPATPSRPVGKGVWIAPVKQHDIRMIRPIVAVARGPPVIL